MYIALEGIVGVGKTTIARRLAEYLRKKYRNRQVILTQEPGGNQISDAIRKLVQATVFDEPMDPVCEAYLYAADRAQSLRRTVKPCLDKSGIAIGDRCYVSSIAYQGIVRGLGVQTVLEINAHAVAQLVPDKIVFLDLDVPTALTRASDKAGDKWENEGPEFFEKIRAGYLEIAKMPFFSSRWLTVEVIGSEDEMLERVKEAIEL